MQRAGDLRRFEETSKRITANAESFGWNLTELRRKRPFFYGRPADARHQITIAPGQTSIVAAAINMGRSLRLRVVADDVETREELAFLQAHHCDQAQGSYFSAPVRPEQLAGLLRSGIPGTSSLRPPVMAA